jgi:hypothetical protein
LKQEIRQQTLFFSVEGIEWWDTKMWSQVPYELRCYK